MKIEVSEMERKFLCGLFLQIARDEKDSAKLAAWKLLHTKFSQLDQVTLRFAEGAFLKHLINRVRERLGPQLADNTKDHYLRAKTLDAGLESVYNKITSAIAAEKGNEDGKGHDDQVSQHNQGQE